MSMEDRAATSIQARFRGFRWRKKQHRGIKAVTKLQALQRGRFTRREFAELRDFSRDQESFQQSTRRRQIRIWRNEQELYFLQHINAADLEKVRAFQQQHTARVIQRSWRAVTQSTASSKRDKKEIFAPSDRIYTFDPFGLAAPGAKARSHWGRDNECVEFSQRSPQLLLNEKDRAISSARRLPAAIADEEVYAARRKAIQERIKRKATQEKAKTESTPKPRATVSSGTTEGLKPVVNRRRELYEQVIAMKRATTRRVLQYERKTRASRPERELFSAQLVASCENRINYLHAESPDQMTPSKVDNQQGHDEAKMMEKWDPIRRVLAWNHHRRAVCSVLDKRNWWQTQLAGDERDIRRVVVAKSPWENENNIWVWPRSENSNQKEHDADPVRSPSSISTWPSIEIERFLIGDKNTEDLHYHPTGPVSDNEASEWWRAHCTQSHLPTNGALLIEKPYSAEFSTNVTNEGDIFPVCTLEAVANCDLYKLQQRAKRAARTKSIEQDVEQRIKNVATQVGRRVHDVEAQVEANTQLAIEIVRRKEQQRVRITREQQSAMTIQRYARGMQGRKHACEVRAEFFVMVRGRAIRRGRCEECGDQRAVLECQQCEESLHFCPSCWVHVHSTRRRKTHVAIPMTTVVAPLPVEETENTKTLTSREPASNSIKTKFVSQEVNTGPSLRVLPSARKQSKSRSAEPAAVHSKKSVADTKNLGANSSKLENVQTTAPPKVVNTRQNAAPELVEACSLARRVSSEVRESPSTAADNEYVPVQKRGEIGVGTFTPRRTPIQDHSGVIVNDEIDFSTVEADCAMMSEAEVGQDEQLAPIEAAATVDAAASGQPPNAESVNLSPEMISMAEPDDSSNKCELPPGALASAEISNVDVATIESVEQDPASAADPELSSNAGSGNSTSGNPGNCAVTTEKSSEGTNGASNTVSDSTSAGTAAVATDAPPSNDTLTSAEVEQQSSTTAAGPDSDSGTASAAAVTAPEDVGSIEEPPPQTTVLRTFSQHSRDL